MLLSHHPGLQGPQETMLARPPPSSRSLRTPEGPESDSQAHLGGEEDTRVCVSANEEERREHADRSRHQRFMGASILHDTGGGELLFAAVQHPSKEEASGSCKAQPFSPAQSCPAPGAIGRSCAALATHPHFQQRRLVTTTSWHHTVTGKWSVRACPAGLGSFSSSRKHLSCRVYSAARH